MPRNPQTETFQLHRVGALERIREDVEAVLHSDPAARSRLEVLTCYPGLHALWFHRLAFALWWRGFAFAARFISHVARFLTGIEIHPGARIGRRVFIDHGMGVVIGETTIVEDDVLIYKGVVLGGTSCERTIRHPYVKKGAVIGSNVCILGAIVVGENAKIGSGSVVIHDVPDGATVVGIPGRAIQRKEKKSGSLAHADLPDPIARALDALVLRVNDAQKRLQAVEGRIHIPTSPDAPPPITDLQSLYSEPERHEDGSGI